MNWRERLWEQNWLLPLLPNYMKPLNEPALMNEHTKEFVYEAEEFISDLAALTELPRLNKTFKRTIQGFSFKIKIKQKKIHAEFLDTNKSSSTIKKRVYITSYRKNVKMENGFGKIIDSTIYYQYNGKTIVRSIRKHPFFQSLFHHIHRLDLSLSGENIKLEEIKNQTNITQEQQLSPATDDKSQIKALISSAEHTFDYYKEINLTTEKALQELLRELRRCGEEYHLLDIEEKHHMKRMIQHDLPNLLKTYDSLNASQKQEKYEETVRTIKQMASYLQRQANDLQSTRMDRMNHLLKLNELRYNSEDQSNS
ncbi:hypothetical protein HXA34_10130 [Salipaludibacillus agaradhaerens]|uniref:hypothetical protein n=1 Tax=Salipaludibacillus agaradhaerens TaxID=76935 RepID=UPI00215076CE|nr:hypothetical protein [Salipaludibacillus agaradhaerens]MCR6106641.1 hypothetical protein [Salipaludibacillus agaradhaerens]MCR6118674.1 hypothetical protein [Salipaludibacillus agaradhaerens]